MDNELQTLSGREVEVLRLLLAGHDAKSAARLLDLSVHTVNERLRHARRKLGVSSSREAARLLAQAEGQDPNSFVYNDFVVPTSLPQAHPGQRGSRRDNRSPPAWLVWGGPVMLLTTAMLFFAALSDGDDPIEPAQPSPDLPAPSAGDAIDLMPIADTSRDGVVSAEEYRTFSEQGWEFAAQGRDEIRLGELSPISRTAFVGIMPRADGAITRQMYIDAIPQRFRMLDRNGDGVLNADELNGRAFQGQAPPLG